MQTSDTTSSCISIYFAAYFYPLVLSSSMYGIPCPQCLYYTNIVQITQARDAFNNQHTTKLQKPQVC